MHDPRFRRLSGAALIFVIVLHAFGCATELKPGETRKFVLHPPQSIKDGPQVPLDNTVPGVPNFGLISRDLWRGGPPTANGLRWLADLGVKTIIDLRSGGGESADIPPGIKYVRLCTSPFHADKVDVRAVLHQIEISPKPVFIHCQQGRDRTGLAVAAYRLSQGMSAEQACIELRNFHVNCWWVSRIERRVCRLQRDGLHG